MLNDSQIDELWRRLEHMGLGLVRRRLAQGVFGSAKLPLVEEWLRQQERDDSAGIPPAKSGSVIFLSHADADRERWRLMTRTLVLAGEGTGSVIASGSAPSQSAPLEEGTEARPAIRLAAPG